MEESRRSQRKAEPKRLFELYNPDPRSTVEEVFTCYFSNSRGAWEPGSTVARLNFIIQNKPLLYKTKP